MLCKVGNYLSQHKRNIKKPSATPLWKLQITLVYISVGCYWWFT